MTAIHDALSFYLVKGWNEHIDPTKTSELLKRLQNFIAHYLHGHLFQILQKNAEDQQEFRGIKYFSLKT